MNIPQLRFSDFTGDWTKHFLGEIGKFSKGKGVSKEDLSETGVTECIRYGELYTTYNETIDTVFSRTDINTSDLVLSEANDIIIPASGETHIDIAKASCVLKSGVALGGDLNIIKTSNNGVFLSYYLNYKKKNDIAQLAQGVSVVHLYAGQLSKLLLKLPSLPEQQKIACFFIAIDQKISQLKQKKILLEQYKKGVIHKIFSQEIRFKDDGGQEYPMWEKLNGNAVFETISNKNHNSDLPILAITKEHGAIPRDLIDYNISVTEQSIESYKVVEKGDFIISLRSFQGGIEFSDYKGICSHRTYYYQIPKNYEDESLLGELHERYHPYCPN